MRHCGRWSKFKQNMSRLFSYCIPIDDGAAPNPYWGICTLVICKPVIRRNAEVGDWIVATGSTKFGFENKVVYAMEVTQKISMYDYDDFCKNQLPKKIPVWRGKNYIKRLGDSIYDFSVNPPKLRESVHNFDGKNEDGTHDLNGKFALLSDNFYYFGDNPINLPTELFNIVKQGQGHKSNSNSPYFENFVNWISSFKSLKNKVNNPPYFKIRHDNEGICLNIRKEVAEIDENSNDE